MDKKPVVPQYVADMIIKRKKQGDSLVATLVNLGAFGDAQRWIRKGDNGDTFAKAWLYGYEVKKEKLYLASFRDTDQYLGWNEKLGEWFMSCSPFTSCVEQTQETWEGVGIWNNPAFEITEVEE